MNCTFYDALGRDDRRYLLARAIQFFLPGVPQVYYVGLLAGPQRPGIAGAHGHGRDINRHFYTRGEVAEALEQPVVADLCELIRLRNSHPAFGGEFTLLPSAEGTLALRWRQGDAEARLQVDLRSAEHDLQCTPGPYIPQFRLLRYAGA